MSLLSIAGYSQTTETLSASDKTLTGSDFVGVTLTGRSSYSSNRIKMPAGANGFTLTAKNNNITSVVFTWRNSKQPTAFAVSAGTYSSNIWTGDAHEISFINTGTTEVSVIQLVITYGTTSTGDNGNNDNTPSATVTNAVEGPTTTDVISKAVANDLFKNQMVITANGSKKYYNTADVKSVMIDETTGKVKVDDDVFNATASNISFQKAADPSMIENASVKITEAKGWFESVYAKFELVDNASYKAYIKGGQYSDYTAVSDSLIRNYGTYGRVDVVGLKAGSYTLKIAPVISGKEGKASEVSGLAVVNYDRNGFAHWNWKNQGHDGIGAYKDDGTLKEGTRVVYVTADNAKTVSLAVKTNSKGTETTFTGIQQIVYGYQKGYENRPLDIRIIGKLSKNDCDELLSGAEGLQIKGADAYQPMNITIEGIGDDATIWGFGFLLRSVAGVELRNFGIMCFEDDGVSIDTDNSNLWIHNLDIFYGSTGGDADQAKGDGSFDLKGDSKYITCSYNRFWDSGKCSLCGMKSETGPNWITYHHNWFDHADSRMPRIRTMSVHVYNNYYDNVAKYGTGAAYRSNAFVEANYFLKTKHPMLISMQGSDIANDPEGTFSGEDGGMIKAYNNYIDKSIANFRYAAYSEENKVEFDAYEVANRNDQVPATVTAKQGGRKYDNWDTDSSLMYSYTPDDPANVPGIVTGNYGAGRINHGDFTWTFEDNTGNDTHDAALDSTLKNAVVNYSSTLKGFFK